MYFVHRLILAFPVLLLASILIFGGVRVIPGDVCRLVIQSPDITKEQCAKVEHDLGLDKPVVSQYFTWMSGVIRLDFGRSMVNQRPVWSEIRGRAPVTMELALLSSLLAILIALPVGVYSALRQDKFADYFLRLITNGWLSMPGFWVATLLITFPAKWWGYSPPVGYVEIWVDPLKNLEQLALASISLGLALSASLARMTRSTMLEVLRQDYVRTARAKGLRERDVLSRHALKNALLPVVTLLGLQLSFLIGGTVIQESIFGLPGLGTLLLSSVILKNYTEIQGLVVLFALMIVILNLVIDLSYALLDPRVRFS